MYIFDINILLGILGRIMPPLPGCPYPNPEPVNMLFHMARGNEGCGCNWVCWSADLERGDYPDGPVSSHRSLEVEEVGQSQKEVWRCYTAVLEGGRRGHKPRQARNAGNYQKLEKARKQSLPELPERNDMILAQWGPFQTSGCQNYKVLNLCSFKSLVLW